MAFPLYFSGVKFWESGLKPKSGRGNKIVIHGRINYQNRESDQKQKQKGLGVFFF